MLAPGVQGSSHMFPYAMTNVYGIAYSFLLLNIITFFVASLHFRKITNILSFVLLGHIILFLLLTLGGFVQSHNGEYMSMLSWGWFFILIGCVALLYTIYTNKKRIGGPHTYRMFDTIIGIIGIFVLTTIFGLIVYVSQINAYKKTHIIEGVFGSDNIETHSGITLSPAFEKIYNFTFTRQDDLLEFIAKTATGYTQYPQKIQLTELPRNIFSTQNKQYILQGNKVIKDEDTFVGTIQGKTENALIVTDSHKTFIFMHSGAEYTLDSSYSNIRDIKQNGEDIYWLVHTNSGEILYKNNTKINENFSHIKKYAVGDAGIIFLAQKKKANTYNLYNNTTKIFTETGFIHESFESNGTNIWYALKNTDSTYSLFFNNEKLKKSYEEILGVFLQKDDNGYVFFARRPGTKDICVITRYQGENCGFESILPPKFEADKNGVIFMGFKDKKWGIYRNTKQIIDAQYLPYQKSDTKQLQFFFDTTRPEYFLCIQKTDAGLILNKRGTLYPQKWKDIKIRPFFGYDGKVLIQLQDESGWRIAEL
ncbi:hypothetical protein CSB09_03440 [Candidatus Gracilibacteria bacterium]|nr:MAG: hypothetical protein CSB09_03440 [Candidatus Gracilibacteria bacterium]